jgi:hypothetical protein
MRRYHRVSELSQDNREELTRLRAIPHIARWRCLPCTSDVGAGRGKELESDPNRVAYLAPNDCLIARWKKHLKSKGWLAWTRGIREACRVQRHLRYRRECCVRQRSVPPILRKMSGNTQTKTDRWSLSAKVHSASLYCFDLKFAQQPLIGCTSPRKSPRFEIFLQVGDRTAKKIISNAFNVLRSKKLVRRTRLLLSSSCD